MGNHAGNSAISVQKAELSGSFVGGEPTVEQTEARMDRDNMVDLVPVC